MSVGGHNPWFNFSNFEGKNNFFKKLFRKKNISFEKLFEKNIGLEKLIIHHSVSNCISEYLWGIITRS